MNQKEEAVAKAGRKQTKSSPDLVFDAVVSGLRFGTLVPGQRLVEADLTEIFGVSRGPVREALKRLAAEGVVTLSQNRGAFIRALNRKDADDLLRVLEVNSALGAELATRQIAKGHMRAEFDAAAEKLLSHESIGDSRDFIEARRAFYDVLFQASDNLELIRIVPLMQIHLLRLQFQMHISAEDRKKQFDEYRAVIAAIRAGQARRAGRLVKIHIWRTRLSISRMPDDAFSGKLDKSALLRSAG